ncbi:MAG: hypothetical protein O3B01_26510 [Planctomycetota bacterium]|nr:hypothetical protein [Planctomycetota bacterium]
MKTFSSAALILITASLAGFVAAVVIRGRPAPMPPRTELKTADWDSYSYQASGASTGTQFNIKMVIKKKSDGPPNVRLVFNQQDKANYYFVEFGGQKTRIAKVQNGIEIRIGTEGRPASFEGAEQILIKRRELQVEVCFGQEKVAFAYDDSYQGGQIVMGQVGDAVALESFRIQPTGDLFFSDDFMKAATQEGEWDVVSGNWKVETLKNPGLSSNAFFMVGTADSGKGIATTGHWFWEDYSFQISCRPMDGKPVGILACYRGADDYYLFRWESAGAGPDVPRMQLIRVNDGKETVLAAASGHSRSGQTSGLEEQEDPTSGESGYGPKSGFTTGQWYELRISIQGNQISAAVDGNVFLRAIEPSILSGRIGIYTEGIAHFDDIYVAGERLFRESFAEYCSGKWQELGGDWQYGKPQDGVLKARSMGPAKLVSGSDKWRDYSCSVDLVSRQSGDIGLCSHYQGEGNYYLMRWIAGPGKLQLVAVVEGKEKLLAESPWSGPNQQPSRFTLETLNDLVKGSVDGHLILAAPAEEKLSLGKVGVWVQGGEAIFDNLEVRFPKPEEPVLTLNEVFAGENSMADWSTSESDWIVQKEQISKGENGDETLHHYWHRSNFPGDCDLEFSSSEGESMPENCALTLAGEGTSTQAGYQLRLQKRPASLSLFRNGLSVSKQAIEGTAFRNMKLSRQGEFILVYLDGKRVLSYRDGEPLRGNRVAFTTEQMKFDTASLSVFSRNLYSYNFQKAPGEWRQAGGVWKVTNRWQCDPRWSFFSGESERVAAIWNKRTFEGDLTLEFSAGIKMNSSKGQSYEYASDINATICADGSDLTSGYSFLFGGKGNSGTQIVRKTEIVAESPERIPVQVLHRRWFAIKIQNRGGHLTLWIDNRKILEYTDPVPLAGRKLALWTYNNGLMVSRVRISSESGRTMERPDAGHPQVSRSIYD